MSHLQAIEALNPALDSFLDRFRCAVPRQRTFDHLHTYVRGLLSDLPRKSVEPIALQAGTPVRTLQEFLRDHLWSFHTTRDLLQQHIASVLPTLPANDLGTVGQVDETSAEKKGDKTPGVQRQYLGCLGKVDNGIVTVHLAVSRLSFETMLDGDLYLPKSWDDDRTRCRKADIPDDLTCRPKWRISLEQLDRARGNGVQLDWLTFDEEYGKAPGYRKGLDERQQLFVGEVPRSFSCLTAIKNGAKPADDLPPRQAHEVVRRGTAFIECPWSVLRMSRQTVQDQVWRVKAARVWVHDASGWSEGTYWLIWASNDETGEEKFWLSNAPATESVEKMVRVGLQRYPIEHGFRVCKSELGLSHYEGRSYVGLMRHMTLCWVSMAFAACEAQRPRGEKYGCGSDDGAGVSVDGSVGAALDATAE